MERIGKFLRDESGATAVEYGIIIALIAGAIVGVLTVLGTDLSGLFNRISGRVAGAG
jgi:pilus assembly protein Flp/PilA